QTHDEMAAEQSDRAQDQDPCHAQVRLKPDATICTLKADATILPCEHRANDARIRCRPATADGSAFEGIVNRERNRTVFLDHAARRRRDAPKGDVDAEAAFG